MSQSELQAFVDTGPEEPPYPIPFPSDITEHAARSRQRKWYWNVHDRAEYECPDCERTIDEVGGFDVHHIDQDPYNGDPDNIVALCRRCHAWRHSEKKSLSGLTNKEWRDEFMNITESEFLR